MSRHGVTCMHIFLYVAMRVTLGIDACQDPLPDETLVACRDAQGILLGAVGGPKWDDPNAAVRPEQGTIRML